MFTYKPIKAKAHTPPYKIHKYFARRPWNVFAQLIEQFSKEGETVLDPFCGGGVTIYEGLRLKRKVIGYDLNPLSTFIIENMVQTNVDKKEFKKNFNLLDEYLCELYSDFKNELWNELAFEVECPFCSARNLLKNENKVKNGCYKCSNTNCIANDIDNCFRASNAIRTGYKYLFSVQKSKGSKEKIKYESKNLELIQNHIEYLFNEVREKNLDFANELIPKNWDRQHEDILERKGIKRFSDLFTKRNLYINRLLLSKINELTINDPAMYKLLRMVFSSSLRDTNIMSFTVSSWQGGSPTTWSRHAYWIPNQFCEVNVRDSFRKAYKKVLKSIEFNNKESLNPKIKDGNKKSDWNVFLLNKSVGDELMESSVDAIITDPPYGSNVQYLELSHFWYPWNKDLYVSQQPQFSEEAIFNRKKFDGYKSIYDYEENLYKVFCQSYRALKDKRYMVLTFNNRDVSAWLAILIAIFRAGFSLEEDKIYFQDGVKNYKQTAHTKSEGSPYGDFIYAFKKDSANLFLNNKDINEERLIDKFEEIFNITHNNISDKNTDLYIELLTMFKELIPYVQAFVVTNLENKKKHNLYTKINKKFLDEIYGKKKK